MDAYPSSTLVVVIRQQRLYFRSAEREEGVDADSDRYGACREQLQELLDLV
jgi:hypothetical protein